MGRCIRRFAAAVSLLALLLVVAVPTAGADGDEPRGEVTVLGARVEPLKATGKPWDADHGAIPGFVYRQLAGVTGFPPLAILALIPYRNRPDPYVIVRLGDDRIARSPPIQGTFAPTWRLRFPLPAARPDTPSRLAFEVHDDDVRDDDEIGTATVDLAALLAAPGPHTVAGTGGLYDISIAVRNPAAPGAGPPVTLRLEAVKVVARPSRPAGGDWDAGGNPLRRRFPKLRLPKGAEGLHTVRPDLSARLEWSGGGVRTSPVATDSFEMAWTELSWRVVGRTGIGDALLVSVEDRDLALSDPVGSVHVPLEELLEARERGVWRRKGDELSGIQSIEIRFEVE